LGVGARGAGVVVCGWGRRRRRLVGATGLRVVRQEWLGWGGMAKSGGVGCVVGPREGGGGGEVPGCRTGLCRMGRGGRSLWR